MRGDRLALNRLHLLHPNGNRLDNRWEYLPVIRAPPFRVGHALCLHKGIGSTSRRPASRIRQEPKRAHAAREAM